MSEMIERVARALLIHFLRPDDPPDDWAEEEDELEALYRPAARAVIEAMREPTEAMIEAAVYEESDLTPEGHRQVHRAMIDAALTPEGEAK